MLKRLLYFGYYLKTLDWKKLNTFMDFVSKKCNRSKFRIWQDVFKDSIKFNVSILDYFLFRFYEIPPKEKETFAGTGYMYEYQLLMNPKSTREIMDNKLVFLSEYKDYVKHTFASISDFEHQMTNAQNLLKGKDSKIVFKEFSWSMREWN